MSDITLVVLCAGTSSRFGLKTKKQWLRVKNEPLWFYVTKKLQDYSQFDKVIVTAHEDELIYMQNFSNTITFVQGGNTRQESMNNALNEVTTKYVMISDVARSCVPKGVIHDLITHKDKADCIVPFLEVSDTVVYNNETINRDNVKLIQTPQLSNTQKLKDALVNSTIFTDDSSAIKANKGTICYVKGSHQSKKLTFENDLIESSCLTAPSSDYYTGTGFDIHPFEDNKQMFLGGIKIDVPFGFKAHSDGDVLIHSLIDSLLGAAGAGDIGEFFPDNDAQYKNIDSKILLSKIVSFVNNVGFEIVNIDLTIIAEKPKITPYKTIIKTKIAELLNIQMQFINIKATTSEKLGFIGRSEGVAVQSIATLKFYDWKKR